MPRRDLTLAEQTNVRTYLRMLRVRFGGWHAVERALPISHSVRVEITSERCEVSAAIAFRVAKVLDASLYDVLAGTALPVGVCKHCGRLL